MPYLAAKPCRKRWSSGFLKSSWMTLWSTYWTARSTSTLSTPIRSNCRQAIVPVASCSSVWSILRPASSPGAGEPLTMWSLRMLATRFAAIAHHLRETSSLPPHSTQPDDAPTPGGSGRRPRGSQRHQTHHGPLFLVSLVQHGRGQHDQYRASGERLYGGEGVARRPVQKDTNPSSALSEETTVTTPH